MSELLIARIIQPVGLEEFCSTYWGRRHLRVSGRGGAFNEQFVPARDIENSIAAPDQPAWHFAVSRDGAMVPVADYSEVRPEAHSGMPVVIPARLTQLYGSGYSLVFQAAHRRISSLAQVCAGLSEDFGFPVRANIYKTPIAATGFIRHGDIHEVLVLQVAGSKRWKVWGADGCEEFDLTPGDMLYLPRGVEHAPFCVDSEFLHITIGLHPRYGYGLRPGHGDERFPLRAEPPAFASPEEKESFRREFGEVGVLSGQSVIKRAASTEIAVRNLGSTLKVECPDGFVTVPLFLSSTVDFALSGDEFRIDQLPGMLPESGKLGMMQLFLKEGLLSVVRI